MCDGAHFPLASSATDMAENLCSSLCPATETKVFFGSDIQDATAEDGSTYSDLPAAFLYRERLVSGCTCNGTHTGLAKLPAESDPTLRNGDIVASRGSLDVFHRRKRGTANFTPVRKDLRLPKRLRSSLAKMRIQPPD